MTGSVTINVIGTDLALTGPAALAQNDIRRMLGFLVISGIGMMLAGLALGSATGISGAVFYAMHSMIVMTALYFMAGIMGERMAGFGLDRAGGLYTQTPWLAALALVLFLSVSGLPPFSGLWPKAFLVKASLDVGAWWLAFAILLTGLLTTIAVGRTFAFAFWRERPQAAGGAAGGETAGEASAPAVRRRNHATTTAALVGLTALSVAAGVYPEPVIQVTDRIAAELLAPTGYVESVFPPEPMATEPAMPETAAPETEVQTEP